MNPAMLPSGALAAARAVADGARESAGSGAGAGGPSVVAWLESGAPFGGRAPERRIDTHAASVFLLGDRAWKLKRPVALGYLDFSTAEKRRAALAEELRLNRRTAPELYLALHPVWRAADGALMLGAEGAMPPAGMEVADWLLEMRRFPDDALLADVAARGGLAEPLLRELADHVAAMHAAAPSLPRADGAAHLRRVAEGNAVSMARFPQVLPPAQARALTEAILARIDAQAALLDARGREGRIRHVHGDLHLANIALLDGHPLAFDCLEFDPELATTDLLYDLAFLLMDLWERGLRNAANRVFNRYVDRMAEEEAGVVLLPVMMAVRATIRAHVLAAQAARAVPNAADAAAPDAALAAHARHYLALARALAEPDAARLVAIGGLSGTGKSTLAQALGGDVGGAPGARILRSDVLRKRLAGVAPEVRLAASAYSREASDRVYAALDALARPALAGGVAVIADAVFAAAEERASIGAVARAAGCRFDGLWLMLGEEGRVARIEARVGDASDADAAVARAQTLRLSDAPEDWVRLDAGGDRAALIVRARAALELAPEVSGAA